MGGFWVPLGTLGALLASLGALWCPFGMLLEDFWKTFQRSVGIVKIDALSSQNLLFEI